MTTTRQTFLKRAAAAGLAGGGIVAMPAVAVAAVTPTAAEIGALNYLLELEYMQVDYYAQALKEASLKGETFEFASVARVQDNAHARRLRRHLGPQAAARPKFTFTDKARNEAVVQETAGTLENLVVRAYLGEMRSISTPAAIQLVASMLAVDARHAAWIRQVVNGSGARSPSPNALAGAATRAQVDAGLKALKFAKI